jgi:hypothetical protein
LLNLLKPSLSLRRNVLPVLLVLGLHGAVLLAWINAKRAPLASPAATYIVTTFVAAPAPRRIAPPLTRPRSAAASAVRSAPVAVAPAAAESPEPPAPAAPAAEPSAGAILAQARRDIGAIDKALRGKEPPVPLLRPDTPIARFETAMAGAYKDRSMTAVMDRYVAADGVTITRLTQRGKVRCFMSGTVNASNGILSDTSRPRADVNCPPAHAGWTRI